MKEGTALSKRTTEALGFFDSDNPIIKLSKDMKNASKMMSLKEARFIVDLYYQLQNVRVRAGNQVDRSAEIEEPVEVLRWTHANFGRMERDIYGALGVFAAQYDVGQWLQGICGIASVLSAAFLTTFDIRERLFAPCGCTDKVQDKLRGKGIRSFVPIGGDYDNGILHFRCSSKKCGSTREINRHDLRSDDGILRRPTGAGHWWNFAGLNPDVTWEKGKLRPWNDRAKVFCYKAGECFIKVQNRDSDVYGKLYKERRRLEEERNLAGHFKAMAEKKAQIVGKGTEAYKHYSIGRLPPDHLKSRARRYAVKIFLSHMHDVAYRDFYHEAPPVPYAFSDKCKGDHRHFIEVPVIETSGKSLTDLYAG